MELSSSKTIAKNTVFLYFRMALSMIVSLYTVRAVVNILGVEDYGLYNAIGGVVTSLSFLTAVLANASQRFFAIEIGKGENGDVNKYLNAILHAYLILVSIVFICVESIGVYFINNTMTIPEGRLVASNWVLQFSLLTFVISLLGAPFYALIIAYERMNIYAFVSIFESFAKLGIVYLLLKSPIDQLVFYSILLLTVTLLANCTYIYNVFRIIKLKFTLKVEKGILKNLFSYSSWTLFGTISGVASTQGVSILLNIFSGPLANAAFAISNQISTTIQMFASSFFTAVRPPLTKSYSASNFEYMNKLFDFSNKAIFALTFTIVLPILTSTHFIMKMWLGNVPLYLVEFVRFMVVYALLISLSNPITTIVQAAGKVKKYHTVVDGFALLILPLLYLYLKMGYDVSNAIGITIFVFLIAHVLRLYVLSKFISYSITKYIKGFVIPATFVILISYLVVKATSLQLQGTLVSNIIIIGLSSLCSLLFSFLLLLNKEEKNIMYKIIRKKK